MTRQRTIVAAGSSPLTQYINLLVSVPKLLDRRIRRDAEAIRILEAGDLAEAHSRVARRNADRERAKIRGELVLSRRIWTRRDELRLNLRRGFVPVGWVTYGVPACRTARLVAWLEPSSGPSLHDLWFRSAVNEAREYRSLSVLLPEFKRAKDAYGQMMVAARRIAQDDNSDDDFQTARSEVGRIACELMDYTKEPTSAQESPPESLAITNPRSRGSNPPPPESPSRLTVSMDSETVTLDGETYRVGLSGAEFLQAMLDANGDRVAARRYFTQASRDFFDKLPPALHAVIDRSNSGCRLSL